MSSVFIIPEPLVCFLWTWGYPSLEYKNQWDATGSVFLYFLLSYTASHCRCREWGLIFKHQSLITGKGDRAAQVSTHSRWCRSWHPTEDYRPGKEGKHQVMQAELRAFQEMPLLNACVGQETTKPGSASGDSAWVPSLQTCFARAPVPFTHMGFLHRVLTWLCKGSTRASSSRYSCNSSLNFFFFKFIYLRKNSLCISVDPLSIPRGHRWEMCWPWTIIRKPTSWGLGVF